MKWPSHRDCPDFSELVSKSCIGLTQSWERNIQTDKFIKHSVALYSANCIQYQNTAYHNNCSALLLVFQFIMSFIWHSQYSNFSRIDFLPCPKVFNAAVQLPLPSSSVHQVSPPWFNPFCHFFFAVKHSTGLHTVLQRRETGNKKRFSEDNCCINTTPLRLTDIPPG